MAGFFVVDQKWPFCYNTRTLTGRLYMIDNQSNLMVYINRCAKQLETAVPIQERIKILRSMASTADKLADDLAFEYQDLQIHT